MSILGTRVLRTEDPGFLSRGAIYTEDVQDERLAGACYVHFVRSTVAHAKISSVDVSAALEGDGVIAVYTAADVAAGGLEPVRPMAPSMNQAMLQTLLASDIVRFVGEPVAVVVTEEMYQGEDAIELVDVDYDFLPAVVNMNDALSGARGLLFPEAGTNVVCTFGDASASNPDLFDGCEVVASEVIQNTRVAPAPMESRSAAAVWGEDGRLTAWIPNQGAQGTKGALVAALGVAPEIVRIITPDVGGGFGAKFGVDPEAVLTCWIAQQLGRPARWSETRMENLVGMTHGRAQQHKLTIGGMKDGTVLAYRIEILQDCGAYPRIGAFLPSLTILMTPGPVQHPAGRVVGLRGGHQHHADRRLPGRRPPEAAAAIDRAIDLFAGAAGVDPAEVRRKNLLPKFTEPHTTAFGAIYDSGDYVTALERALDAADYPALRAEQARRRAERRHPAARHRPVLLRGDHRARRRGRRAERERHRRGAPGRHRHRADRHLAARAGPPDGVGDAGQRGARHPDRQDHRQVGRHRPDPRGRRHRRLALAPARRRGGAAGLPRAPRRGQRPGGRNPRGVPRRPGVRRRDEHVQRQGGPRRLGPAVIAGRSPSGSSSAACSPQPGATFPFGTHVAVVEVDTETGKVFFRRIVTVDDAGTVMNPLLAEGQRHGGIAQGAAQAFLEEVVYDEDGNPLTATFADYPFLSATEVPSFELVDMETPTSYNPLGAKGIGEAGSIGATPAVQNAVIDAVSHLGVTHIDMPTSSQRVWRAINAARSSAANGSKEA